MQSFKDKSGATWEVELTLAAVKRVKVSAGVDLLKVGEPVTPKPKDPEERKFWDSRPLFVLLLEEIELQGSVLWAIVEPQAKARGVEPEAFAESLGPENAAEAFNAMHKAIVDFFRALGRSAEVKALEGSKAGAATFQEKQAEIIESGMTEAMQKLEARVVKAKDAALASIDATLGK